MKRIILFLVLIFAAFDLGTTAQKPVSTKLLGKSPSIYIEYDKTDAFSKSSSSAKYEVAWFRLHNNTRFLVRFCAYDNSMSRTGKPGIQYEIEKMWELSADGSSTPPVLISSFPATDLCNYTNLESGKTYPFGVPKTELSIENTRLRVRFQFPWESERDVLLGNEAEHFVYFYPSKLK